jgi:dTDP-4-amino-4,6-dideoxygalactose transaminase
MTIRFPIVKPRFPSFDEVAEDFKAILESGMVTTGEKTREFEHSVSSLLGVQHVIALNSCTSGLALGLRAMGLTSGEVVIPSFTFTATALAAIWAGLKPVFCDCEEGTLTISPDSLIEAITPNTVAVMPVAIFGVPPCMDEITAISRKHNLKVLCDSAQALGATYKGQYLGGFGDAEVFSLSPTKVVTAIEGGLFTTNDEALASKIRQMRDYGKSPDGEDIQWVGLSARFSELHAVLGRHNLGKMLEYQASRRQSMAHFIDKLEGLKGVSPVTAPEDREGSLIYMVLRIDSKIANRSREDLCNRLAEQGIQSKKYFWPPLHEQEVYKNRAYRRVSSLNVSELASRECLAIPLYAHMTSDEVDTIADAVIEAMA